MGEDVRGYLVYGFFSVYFFRGFGFLCGLSQGWYLFQIQFCKRRVEIGVRKGGSQFFTAFVLIFIFYVVTQFFGCEVIFVRGGQRIREKSEFLFLFCRVRVSLVFFCLQYCLRKILYFLCGFLFDDRNNFRRQGQVWEYYCNFVNQEIEVWRGRIVFLRVTVFSCQSQSQGLYRSFLFYRSRFSFRGVLFFCRGQNDGVVYGFRQYLEYRGDRGC